MTSLIKEVGSYLTAAKRWWSEQASSVRNWTVGIVVGIGVFFTGGLVLHAAMTGIMVNFFFWYGLYNPQMKAFMERHGRKIDVAITIGSIAVGLVVGPTMGLAMMFIAGFFSLIRRAVCPALNEQGLEEGGDTIEGQYIPGPQEARE